MNCAFVRDSFARYQLRAQKFEFVNGANAPEILRRHRKEPFIVAVAVGFVTEISVPIRKGTHLANTQCIFASSNNIILLALTLCVSVFC